MSIFNSLVKAAAAPPTQTIQPAQPIQPLTPPPDPAATGTPGAPQPAAAFPAGPMSLNAGAPGAGAEGDPNQIIAQEAAQKQQQEAADNLKKTQDELNEVKGQQAQIQAEVAKAQLETETHKQRAELLQEASKTREQLATEQGAAKEQLMAEKEKNLDHHMKMMDRMHKHEQRPTHLGEYAKRLAAKVDKLSGQQKIAFVAFKLANMGAPILEPSAPVPNTDLLRPKPVLPAAPAPDPILEKFKADQARSLREQGDRSAERARYKGDKFGELPGVAPDSLIPPAQGAFDATNPHATMEPLRGASTEPQASATARPQWSSLAPHMPDISKLPPVARADYYAKSSPMPDTAPLYPGGIKPQGTQNFAQPALGQDSAISGTALTSTPNPHPPTPSAATAGQGGAPAKSALPETHDKFHPSPVADAMKAQAPFSREQPSASGPTTAAAQAAAIPGAPAPAAVTPSVQTPGVKPPSFDRWLGDAARSRNNTTGFQQGAGFESGEAEQRARDMYNEQFFPGNTANSGGVSKMTPAQIAGVTVDSQRALAADPTYFGAERKPSQVAGNTPSSQVAAQLPSVQQSGLSPQNHFVGRDPKSLAGGPPPTQAEVETSQNAARGRAQEKRLDIQDRSFQERDAHARATMSPTAYESWRTTSLAGQPGRAAPRADIPGSTMVLGNPMPTPTVAKTYNAALVANNRDTIQPPQNQGAPRQDIARTTLLQGTPGAKPQTAVASTAPAAETPHPPGLGAGMTTPPPSAPAVAASTPPAPQPSGLGAGMATPGAPAVASADPATPHPTGLGAGMTAPPAGTPVTKSPAAPIASAGPKPPLNQSTPTTPSAVTPNTNLDMPKTGSLFCEMVKAATVKAPELAPGSKGSMESTNGGKGVTYHAEQAPHWWSPMSKADLAPPATPPKPPAVTLPSLAPGSAGIMESTNGGKGLTYHAEVPTVAEGPTGGPVPSAKPSAGTPENLIWQRRATNWKAMQQHPENSSYGRLVGAPANSPMGGLIGLPLSAQAAKHPWLHSLLSNFVRMPGVNADGSFAKAATPASPLPQVQIGNVISPQPTAQPAPAPTPVSSKPTPMPAAPPQAPAAPAAPPVPAPKPVSPMSAQIPGMAQPPTARAQEIEKLLPKLQKTDPNLYQQVLRSSAPVNAAFQHHWRNNAQQKGLAIQSQFDGSRSGKIYNTMTGFINRDPDTWKNKPGFDNIIGRTLDSGQHLGQDMARSLWKGGEALGNKDYTGALAHGARFTANGALLPLSFLGIPGLLAGAGMQGLSKGTDSLHGWARPDDNMDPDRYSADYKVGDGHMGAEESLRRNAQSMIAPEGNAAGGARGGLGHPTDMATLQGTGMFQPPDTFAPGQYADSSTFKSPLLGSLVNKLGPMFYPKVDMGAYAQRPQAPGGYADLVRGLTPLLQQFTQGQSPYPAS